MVNTMSYCWSNGLTGGARRRCRLQIRVLTEHLAGHRAEVMGAEFVRRRDAQRAAHRLALRGGAAERLAKAGANSGDISW